MTCIPILINRDFQTPIQVVAENGSLWPLSGTWALRFFDEGNPVPVVVATVGSGLASVVTGLVTPAVLAATTVLLSAGYGALELARTDTGNDVLFRIPVRHVAVGEAVPEGVPVSIRITVAADAVAVSAVYPSVAALKAAMNLDQVNNTSDANKPLSNAVIAALAGKSDVGHTHPYAPAVHTHPYSDIIGAADDITRGMAARDRLSPALSGRQAIIVDFVARGFCRLDDGAASQLLTLENVPGLLLSSPANALNLTRHKTMVGNASNAIRYSHDGNGTSVGALFEPGFSYLNGITQPMVAQLNVSSNVTDSAAPDGWAGNWIGFGNNAVLRFRYGPSLTTVIGQDYAREYEIMMEDGLPPVIGVNSATGDFSFIDEAAPQANAKKISDGSAGYDIIGPLSGGVYLVRYYFTATSTSGNRDGAVIKYATQSARQFRVGRVNLGAGRFLPTGFPNTSATPNAKSGDTFRIPFAGFQGKELTLVTEFRQPVVNAGSTCAVIARKLSSGQAESLGIFCGPGTVLPSRFNNGGNIAQTIATATPGVIRRAAVVFSSAERQIKSKVTGIAAPVPAAWTPGALVDFDAFEIGNFNGAAQMGDGVLWASLIDRAWSSAEIAGFTG